MYRRIGWALRVSGSGGPPLTGKGSGTELCVLGGGGSAGVDGPHCMIYMSDETGNAQKASDNARHSTNDNTGTSLGSLTKWVPP